MRVREVGRLEEEEEGERVLHGLGLEGRERNERKWVWPPLYKWA